MNTFPFCICWQQSVFVVPCIRLCIFVLCRKQSGNVDVCIPIGIFVFGGNSRWIVGGGTLPVLQWGRGGLQVRSGSSLPSKFSWNNLKSDDTVLQKYNNVFTWYSIKWGQTTEWCLANKIGWWRVPDIVIEMTAVFQIQEKTSENTKMKQTRKHLSHRNTLTVRQH